jgi:hypothetical protein
MPQLFHPSGPSFVGSRGGDDALNRFPCLWKYNTFKLIESLLRGHWWIWTTGHQLILSESGLKAMLPCLALQLHWFWVTPPTRWTPCHGWVRSHNSAIDCWVLLFLVNVWYPQYASILEASLVLQIVALIDTESFSLFHVYLRAGSGLHFEEFTNRSQPISVHQTEHS